MGKNSTKATVKAMSDWRESLPHIRERKRKQAERNRNRNTKR